MTLEQLRAGGIDFPAVVIGELELNGYTIERVYEHGRQIGVRLLEADTPRSTRLTPAPPMAPSFAISAAAATALAGCARYELAHCWEQTRPVPVDNRLGLGLGGT